MKDFNRDFEFFTELIRSDKNFAYARYADGEVALMKGRSIGSNSQAYVVDGWSAPTGITKVGIQLLDSLKHDEENYYYAISSNTDFEQDYEFLISRIKRKENITFANLWINANYQKMKRFYETFEKEVYVVCNEKAQKSNFPFKVIELFGFPYNCVNYWEDYGDDYISQLLDYVSQVNNATFFISAGPVSEILIDKMYLCNPQNQYIDVGSSIDEYVHGYKTRPYMDPDSKYAKEVSQFTNLENLSVSQLKILIPTCDKYIHLIEGLMYTVNKFWTCKNTFLILGYKPPNFRLLPNWQFINLGIDTGPKNWSNDLIRFFTEFKEDYFINMIDDTLMTRPSNMRMVEEAYKYMLNNRGVKKCFLHGSLSSGDKSLLGDIRLDPTPDLEGFYDINQTAEYRTSIQSAIWNRDYFLELLKPGLNPWQFETQHVKNDGARILTTVKNHPTMYSHLYRVGNQLIPNWYASVFEETTLPEEDILYLSKLLNLK